MSEKISLDSSEIVAYLGGRDQETLCHGERGCATSLFRART